MKGDIIPVAGQGLKSHRFPKEKRGQLSVWRLMANVETHSLEIAVMFWWGDGCCQNRGSYLVRGREVIKMDIILAASEGQTFC